MLSSFPERLPGAPPSLGDGANDSPSASSASACAQSPSAPGPPFAGGPLRWAPSPSGLGSFWVSTRTPTGARVLDRFGDVVALSPARSIGPSPVAPVATAAGPDPDPPRREPGPDPPVVSPSVSSSALVSSPPRDCAEGTVGTKNDGAPGGRRGIIPDAFRGPPPRGPDPPPTPPGRTGARRVDAAAEEGPALAAPDAEEAPEISALALAKTST